MKIRHPATRRPMIAYDTSTPATPPAPRKVISNRAVNPAALDVVRPILLDASEDLARAVAVYDRVLVLRDQLVADAAAAARRPATARAAHLQHVVDELLHGRYPNDTVEWADVLSADKADILAAARRDAAALAVTAAAAGVAAALAACWPTTLPWLARQRPTRPNDQALATLAQSIVWPSLDVGPGIATMNTSPSARFSRWWPLSFLPADKLQRAERKDWTEWAWGELAAGRFSTDDGELSFTNDWTVPERSPYDDHGPRGRPVVEVSAESVAAYADEVARLGPDR